MEEKYYKILVKRYVEKKLTDDELEIFIHLTEQGKLDKFILEAMDKELYTDENQPQVDIDVSKPKLSIFRRWAIAAMLIAALGVSIYFIKENKPTSWFTRGQLATVVISNKDIIHIVNSSKLISKQILPDGSAVWLQPRSRLSYPSAFKEGKLRKVDMQGEAFFEVTKDAKHPFVITSGEIQTRVWGTSFRIKAIPGEITRVSVLTGKVSVSVVSQMSTQNGRLNQLKVMLRPFEEATYINVDLKKRTVSQKTELLIWHKSNLSFENATLATIIEALNNNYKVHIKNPGPELNHYHITADFNGKNLPDILLLICKSVHATYTFNGNDITMLNLKQQKAAY